MQGLVRRLTAMLVSAGVAGVSAWACCPVWPEGEPIRLADQRILMAYDPGTGIEHVVRAAGFAGDRAGAEGSFGMLVPSPAEPEIAEVDGGVFAVLESRCRPRIETVTRMRPRFSLIASLLRSEQPSPPPRMTDGTEIADPAVEVVKTLRVADYDAAVLRADDPKSLGDWLAANGFASRPELVEWAAPYVAKGWMITAFKYGGTGDRLDVPAVRMSFATDKPVIPYRVPSDQVAEAGSGHLLRAYVVGPGRASGTLGEEGSARPWSQAGITYARPLAADGGDAGFLAAALPDGAAAGFADAWLTAYEDPTWPSSADDLSLDFDARAAPYQRVINRLVERDVLVPLDVIGLVAGGLLLFRRRRR